MKKSVVAAIKNLSTTEILMGVLLYVGKRKKDQKFPEQAVYKFFRNLEKNYPQLAGRFQIRESNGRLKSDLIKSTLSFLEMGKTIEVPTPNPVDQYYQPRKSHLDGLKKELEDRKVLPVCKEALSDLAKTFAETV